MCSVTTGFLWLGERGQGKLRILLQSVPRCGRRGAAFRSEAEVRGSAFPEQARASSLLRPPPVPSFGVRHAVGGRQHRGFATSVMPPPPVFEVGSSPRDLELPSDTRALGETLTESLSEGLGSSAHDSRQRLGLLPGPLPVTPAFFAFVSKETLPWLPLNRKLASLKAKQNQLGLGHTGKRCHLQLLRRQSWHGDGRCRGPPARSAFPPSPLSPASPECVPLLCPLSGPGLRDITWLSPRWLRGQVRSLRPIPRHGSGQGQSVLDSKSELLWKQTQE